MKFNTALVFKLILIVLLLTGIAVFGSKAWKDYQVEQDEKRMAAMFSQILDGASTEPPTIKVDYKNQISTGSPLIFGGSHAPVVQETDTWNKLQEVGITSIRKDFFPENALPRNITLEDYKNNVGNIQDINNWDKKALDNINGMYKEAHNKGMKTIGIVAYAPPWLTHSGNKYGIPKDWDAYEDIVKKTYTYYRPNLDYVEIWNEANFHFFFRLENSGMSAVEAYRELYYHAAKAIREVDAEANDGKIIPIGGPVGANPNETEMLEEILKTDKTKDRINFVSYHNYDSKHLKEPSWVNYKRVLEKYGRSDLPIFITEWNYEPSSSTKSPKHTSNEAITYVGNKFVDYLKMGLAGANYHVLEPLDLSKPNEGEGYMGFYRLKNNTAELLPQAKTWRLMSKQMKLGKGESSVYQLDTADIEINGVGFKNVNGERGFVLTNNASSSKLAQVDLSNLNMGSYAMVTIYYASAEHDATKPIYTGEIKGNKNNMKLSVYLPKESVVGVLLSEDKNWFDFVNLPY